MTQVSRPIQIVLVVAVAFAAVWFVALRPKKHDAAPAATAPAPGLTVTPKAAQPATPAPAAKPARPATVDRADRALAHGKLVALLVWNGHSADDRAAHSAFGGLDTHHGRVVPIVITPGQVSRYAAITRGAQVSQTPTLIVVSPQRVARTITGVTDTTELNQVVADMLSR